MQAVGRDRIRQGACGRREEHLGVAPAPADRAPLDGRWLIGLGLADPVNIAAVGGEAAGAIVGGENGVSTIIIL